MDGSHRQAQPHIQRPHPLHVAAGKVVVDGYNVHALALKRIEVGWERGHQGFTFTGDHFRDIAGVQHHAAEQLHVVVTHAKKPPTTLSADRKGLHEDVVERFSGREPATELVRLAAQFLVAQIAIPRLQGVDRLDFRIEAAEIAGVGGAKKARDQPFNTDAERGGGIGDRVPEAFEDFHGFLSCPPAGKGLARWGRRCRRANRSTAEIWQGPSILAGKRRGGQGERGGRNFGENATVC